MFVQQQVQQQLSNILLSENSAQQQASQYKQQQQQPKSAISKLITNNQKKENVIHTQQTHNREFAQEDICKEFQIKKKVKTEGHHQKLISQQSNQLEKLIYQPSSPNQQIKPQQSYTLSFPSNSQTGYKNQQLQQQQSQISQFQQPKQNFNQQAVASQQQRVQQPQQQNQQNPNYQKGKYFQKNQNEKYEQRQLEKQIKYFGSNCWQKIQESQDYWKKNKDTWWLNHNYIQNLSHAKNPRKNQFRNPIIPVLPTSLFQ